MDNGYGSYSKAEDNGSDAGSGNGDNNRPMTLLDNLEDPRCYCGKDRDLTTAEFQCGMCSRYYHSSCVNCQTGPCVGFMNNYQFFCRRCNASADDHFTKRPATFNQMCFTATANLCAQNPDRKYFSKDEIISYMEQNWDALTTGPRKIKQTWHNTVAKTMQKDIDLFIWKEDTPGDIQFALLNDDLAKIGPNSEMLLRMVGASMKAPEQRQAAAAEKRGAKRKQASVAAETTTQTSGIRTRRGEVGSLAKTTPTSYPAEHPFNRDGYRYLLAEPDPHAPNRQAFDESQEWAGKPIPGYLYRLYLESSVMLTLHDRAPQIKLSDSRLVATGEKGYSMARATHAVNVGSWYYEVTISEMPGDSATRIGWSQRLGNLQAPCGYDKFSYSWRSRKGTVFHQSRGRHYGDGSGYREGDVLGFFIHLPYPTDASKLLPPVYKDKPLIKFKSHLYYEEKDLVPEAEKSLKPLRGSKMVMYKNGVSQGVAFENVFDGFYYPAVSFYKNPTITLNFGPDFKFPPSDIKDYKPMSNMAVEAVAQHELGDMLYHIDNEGQLPEF